MRVSPLLHRLRRLPDAAVSGHEFRLRHFPVSDPEPLGMADQMGRGKEGGRKARPAEHLVQIGADAPLPVRSGHMNDRKAAVGAA